MKICYSNGGLGRHAVADTYTAAPGEIVFASEPSDAQLAAAFPSREVLVAREIAVAAAKAALASSDMTVIRCVEAGVAVPQAWRDYRNALRAIASTPAGVAAAALPAQPAYPVGT